MLCLNAARIVWLIVWPSLELLIGKEARPFDDDEVGKENLIKEAKQNMEIQAKYDKNRFDKNMFKSNTKSSDTR